MNEQCLPGLLAIFYKNSMLTAPPRESSVQNLGIGTIRSSSILVRVVPRENSVGHCILIRVLPTRNSVDLLEEALT
jgi:hypothetical protein